MGKCVAVAAVVLGALACGGNRAKHRSPGEGKHTAELPRPEHLVAPVAAEAPQELLGLVVVPNPTAALQGINAFYTRTMPGSQPLNSAIVDLGIGSLVGTTPIAGIDHDKPVWLLFIDPAAVEHPIAVVVGVRDEQALRAWAAADDITADVRGATAIIGSPGAVSTVADYAATNLAVAPLPDHITATAFVERILDNYSAQLTEAFDGVEAELRADSDPTVAAAAAVYTEAIYSLVNQTITASLSYELTPTEVSLVFEIAGAPGSTLSKIAAAQRPSDYAILDVFDAVDTPIGLAGEFDWAPMNQGITGFFELIFPELVTNEEARGAWVELLKQYSGQVVVVCDLAPFRVTSAYAVEDAEETLRLNRIWAAEGLGANSGFSLKPIGTPSLTHRGVPVDVYKMQFDSSKLPPAQTHSPAAQWLSAGFAANATVGSYLISILSPNAVSLMKRRIDAFERGERGTASKGPGPAASRERRESLLMWLDIAPLVAVFAPNAPVPDARIDFGLGFTDTSWLLRISASLDDLVAWTRAVSPAPRTP